MLEASQAASRNTGVDSIELLSCFTINLTHLNGTYILSLWLTSKLSSRCDSTATRLCCDRRPSRSLRGDFCARRVFNPRTYVRTRAASLPRLLHHDLPAAPRRRILPSNINSTCGVTARRVPLSHLCGVVLAPGCSQRQSPNHRGSLEGVSTPYECIVAAASVAAYRPSAQTTLRKELPATSALAAPSQTRDCSSDLDCLSPAWTTTDTLLQEHQIRLRCMESLSAGEIA